MLLNESIKQSIYKIDALLEGNWTLGILVFENGQPYLELDIGELIELDDSYEIEVIAEDNYYPITYQQAINTIDRHFKTPLYAGFDCRIRQRNFTNTNNQGDKIMENIQRFEVFATVTIPVSIPIHAKNENEAIKVANTILSHDNMITSKLSLINAKGEKIKPATHDLLIKIDDVIED